IKKFIEKSYGKKGPEIVQKNITSIDMALAGVEEVKYPKTVSSTLKMHPAITSNAPEFVQKVLGKIAVQKGDELRVSELPEDGTFPTATTQYEKRGIAENIPIWKSEICIQCGQCT
ncbi:hypothetical protein, partial [Treponema pedis]|uniref:hypothetical protein n=1 Tax=Treponema pedis TaxID=409322 RepID=UPI00056E1DDC